MHIFCLDYTVSVSKSYPLRVQNKLTTSATLLTIIRGVQGGSSLIEYRGGIVTLYQNDW